MKSVLGSLLGACPPPEIGGLETEALQLAVEPPLLPAQLHFHGPIPVTADAVPAVHRLLVGGLPNVAPLDEPHAPLTATGALFVVNDAAELFQ
jgi:hypothetical protein